MDILDKIIQNNYGILLRKVRRKCSCYHYDGNCHERSEEGKLPEKWLMISCAKKSQNSKNKMREVGFEPTNS